MKWRKITEDEVRATIQSPDRTEDKVRGRKNAFKLIGDRLLRITYKLEEEQIVIITAISKGG